jgi:hypothetical protein
MEKMNYYLEHLFPFMDFFAIQVHKVSFHLRRIELMKIFSIICLVLVSNFVFGQFAIVRDTNGFCNVRRSSENGTNVIDKLGNGHFVYCFRTNGNRTTIDYTKNNQQLNGQVYYDRLKLISDYQEIPLLTMEKNKIIIGKANIKIIVTEQKFDRSRYKLTFYKENKDQLEYINHKKYWGTDGEIPTKEYKSIEIHLGSMKITLPKIAIDNLFEPNLDATRVNYDKANGILYIQSMNSDGAGNYEVIWKIERGVYKERYIEYGF